MHSLDIIPSVLLGVETFAISKKMTFTSGTEKILAQILEECAYY